MLGFRWVDSVDVLEPQLCLRRIAVLDHRRAIQIEAPGTLAVDPSAIGDQSALDKRGLTRSPDHLFDGTILVQPGARADLLPLLVDLG